MHFLMQYTILKKTFIAVKKEEIKKARSAPCLGSLKQVLVFRN